MAIGVPMAYHGVPLHIHSVAIGVPMAHLWHIHGVPFMQLWRTFGVPLAYLEKKGNCDDQVGTKCNVEKN